MMGVPEKVCCFCGRPAELSGLFEDYAGRPRFVCKRCRSIPIEERNRRLLSGRPPP